MEHTPNGILVQLQTFSISPPTADGGGGDDLFGHARNLSQLRGAAEIGFDKLGGRACWEAGLDGISRNVRRQSRVILLVKTL